MSFTINDISNNTTFTHSITNTIISKSLYNLNNVIRIVSFYLIANCTLNDVRKTETTIVTIQLNDPDPNNFLPINEINENIVISWIQNNSKTEIMKDVLKDNLLIEFNKSEYSYTL